MAQAFLSRLGGDSFEAESAGFDPKPVLLDAVEAMRQVGIDISGARSKSVFELYRSGRIFDYIITVCDEAAAERCPVFPGICRRLNWPFPDPSAFEGTREERLQEVIAVRDLIRERVEAWLWQLRQSGAIPRGSLLS